MLGFDVAQPVGESAGAIKSAGYLFVARYFSYHAAKDLSPSEARKLTGAGLAIVSVFEAAGDRYSSFDKMHGTRDATQAMNLAALCGQPDGSAIYFAVDFDAVAAQVDNGISAYFAAVEAAVDSKYRIGVYGSGLVCRVLGEQGLAELFWLACAPGWAESKTFAGAHIVQQPPTHVLGLSVDLDLAVDGDFGQWPIAAVVPVPVPAVVVPVVAEDPAIAACKQMQQVLAEAGYYNGVIDAWPGTETYSAMSRYRKARGI